jgi:hypothetical protein
MHRPATRRPAASTVISLLALAISLSGTAYAAATIGAADIERSAVTTPKLAKAAVTGSKLATGAVARRAIADDAVAGAQIRAGSIDAAHLAVDSVGEAAIEPGAVTTAGLAPAAVTGAEIADGQVGRSELATDSVGPAQIARRSVRSGDLVIEEQITSTLLPGGQVGSVRQGCGTGQLLGGGHSTGGTNVVNLSSRRISDNIWEATFRNNGTSQEVIVARAYCLAL